MTTPMMKADQTLKEMLKLRGFEGINYVQRNDKKNPPSLTSVNDTSEIVVQFEIDKSCCSSKNLTKIVTDAYSKRKHHDKDFTFILIVRDKITPSLYQACRDIRQSENIFVQIFKLKSLFYNPTKHVLVPEHTRIPRESETDKQEFDKIKQKLLKTLHIDTLEKLPHILEQDAIGSFIGLREGDLCKIVRPSQSAGVHTLYRYTVK